MSAHETAESMARTLEAYPGTGAEMVSRRLLNMAKLDPAAAIAAALYVGRMLTAATSVAAVASYVLDSHRAPFDCPLCGQHIDDGRPCGCGARR